MKNTVKKCGFATAAKSCREVRPVKKCKQASPDAIMQGSRLGQGFGNAWAVLRRGLRGIRFQDEVFKVYAS